MVKVKGQNGYSGYLDGFLQSNLDKAKEVITQDWDMVFVVDGYEGCQPKGSKVLMSDGEFKNIEDIKVGDTLLSPQQDGTNIPSKVTRTTQWFSHENYDIVELNRQKKKLYTCSHNHLIPVNYYVKPRKNCTRPTSERYWEVRHYNASDYSKLSRSSTKKNCTAITSFPIERFSGRQNCPVEPSFLGILLGDGCLAAKQFNITTADKEIMQEISKTYKIMGVSHKKNNLAKTYRFSTRSEIYTQLKKLGLTGKKSGTKFIPKQAKLSDINYRKRLLAGLIDSDGYLSRTNGYSICTKSKQLAQDILFIVKTLGGRGSITKVIKTIKRISFRGSYYNVSFYLGDTKLPIITARKKRYGNTFYKSPNRISIDAIPAKPSMVYGFSLDSPSQWYITDEFTITHNTGKSVLAQQMAFYCDPTLTIDRVCFTPTDFKKAIIKAKKYEAVVYDEAYGGMSSRATLTDMNQSLMKMLAEIRQKNLFVFIVLPCFFELDKYAAVWRSRALIHVYTAAGFKRGFFKFYGQDRKKKLYVVGKKFYNYKVARPNFRGRFVNGYPLNEKEYRARKLQALSIRGNDPEKESVTLRKVRSQRDTLIVAHKNITGLTDRELGKLLSVSRTTITEARKTHENK